MKPTLLELYITFYPHYERAYVFGASIRGWSHYPDEYCTCYQLFDINLIVLMHSTLIIAVLSHFASYCEVKLVCWFRFLSVYNAVCMVCRTHSAAFHQP